ncbi:MAG: lipoyl(octanoyl) transferase LipB [Bryobacterales bacterium]|nr:lipoyl(octanoyl) transferase LipB [Bryobacterales bacterium]
MPDPVLGAAGPAPAAMPPADLCEVRDLGRCGYRKAWDLQLDLVRRRKQGAICDQLLFVEHPPTITMGRNADAAHILAAPDRLRQLGFSVQETDRGGDVTYHGPGQVVAYPILDLRQWQRDVGAYLRALEEVVMSALSDFGIRAQRSPGLTGVWVADAKIAALGVHLSRWVTSHGLALNVSTDLDHFRWIVPCGLARPVTSMERELGRAPSRQAVLEALSARFGEVFGRTVRGRAATGFEQGTGSEEERKWPM